MRRFQGWERGTTALYDITMGKFQKRAKVVTRGADWLISEELADRMELWWAEHRRGGDLSQCRTFEPLASSRVWLSSSLVSRSRTLLSRFSQVSRGTLIISFMFICHDRNEKTRARGLNRRTHIDMTSLIKKK